MTATLNNLFLPVFLFIVFFSIASNLLYTPTKVTVTNQNIVTQNLLTAAYSTEPTQFDKFYTQIKELFQEEIINSSDSPIKVAIAIPQVKEETIPETEPPISQFIDEQITEFEPVENLYNLTQVQEITKVEQIDNIPNQFDEITQSTHNHNIPIQIEEIINNLNKRQTLRLFKPLKMKRKIGKVDKSLAVTKVEIFVLFKENPIEVTAILKSQLPEL